MCFFTFPNKSSKKAYDKGLKEFECGHCPECLQKKSRRWALRASMEARYNVGCMVTLTYDTYKVVNGVLSCIEENPPDPNISLSKRDLQLFFKRLRKHFTGKTIKYIGTAERGKTTHRAHYHALIFGIQFDDLIKYKKSSRGNIIYKSKTLTDIWGKGICTVDCINPNVQVARYCTKYCAKDSGADDTFMLFSRGIGEYGLLKHFNGKSYWIDGREYSIPRDIWRKVLEKRYKLYGYSKYKNREHIENVENLIYNSIQKLGNRIKRRYFWLEEHMPLYENRACSYYQRMLRARKETTYNRYKVRYEYYEKKLYYAECELRKLKNTPIGSLHSRYVNKFSRRLKLSEYNYTKQKEKRDIFEIVRDSDEQYQAYLAYWKRKNQVAELTRPSVDKRILDLPENKYRSYKTKAIQAKHAQYDKHPFIPPRSKCGWFANLRLKPIYYEKSFAPLSRHLRANDTSKNFIEYEKLKNQYYVFTRRREKIKKAIKNDWKILEFDENLLEFDENLIKFGKKIKKSYVICLT